MKGPGQRLTLVSPPHPAITVLLWSFAATAVVLTAWFAGSGLQVDCARARQGCFLIAPNGDRTEVRTGEFRSAKVTHEGAGPTRRSALVLQSTTGSARVASTPYVSAGALEDAAQALDDFFERRTDEVYLTFRNWPLALEVGTPFALVAVLLAIVRRRRFRVTLQWTQDDLAVRRQTLLSTAHAPVHPGRTSVELEQSDAPFPGARRLVLRLADGRAFPVTEWTADERALAVLRGRIESFFSAARSR